MNILVTGGTGTVGSEAVRALLAKGHVPRVMIRNPAKAAGLPPGVQPVVGDLQKPESLATAFAGVDSLFLLTALAPDETQQGLAAVEAARQAGVRRIVYMTVQGLSDALHIPHFGSKKPVLEAVEGSGLEYTILEPNYFFQNDLALKEPMMNYGVYPQPVGPIGNTRVDARDIGEAAAAALVQDGLHGKHFVLAGLEVVNGEQAAAVWSKHLGRPVHYGGDDVEVWGGMVASILPDWLIHDLKIMWLHFQKHGLRATPDDYVRQESLLGHAPRGFDKFAAETAAAWLG